MLTVPVPETVTEEPSWDIGDGYLRWCRGISLPNFLITLIRPDIFAYVSGCHIKLVQLALPHCQVLRMFHPGMEGIELLEAKPSHGVFALAERARQPRIHVYKYQEDSDVLLAEMKGAAENRFRAIRFNDDDFLLALTGVPELVISVWRWTTGDQIMVVDCLQKGLASDLLISPQNGEVWVEWSQSYITFYELTTYSNDKTIIRSDVTLPPNEFSLDHPDPRFGMAFRIDIVSVTFDSAGTVYVVDHLHGFYTISVEAKVLVPIGSLDLSHEAEGVTIEYIVPYAKSIAAQLSSGVFLILFVKDDEIKVKGRIEFTSRVTKHIKNAFATHPNVSFFAITDIEKRIESVVDGRIRAHYVTLDLTLSEIQCICFIERDAKYLGAVTEKGGVYILDSDTGNIVTKWKLPFYAECMTNHPLLPMVAIGTPDGCVIYCDVRDIKNPKIVHRSFLCEDTEIDKLAWTCRGRYMIAGDSQRHHLFLTYGLPSMEFHYLDYSSLPGSIRHINTPASSKDRRLQVVLQETESDEVPFQINNYVLDGESLDLVASQLLDAPIKTLCFSSYKKLMYSYTCENHCVGMQYFTEDMHAGGLLEPDIRFEGDLPLHVNRMLLVGDRLYTFGEDGYAMQHVPPNPKSDVLETEEVLQTHFPSYDGIKDAIISMNGCHLITIGHDNTFVHIQLKPESEMLTWALLGYGLDMDRVIHVQMKYFDTIDIQKNIQIGDKEIDLYMQAVNDEKLYQTRRHEGVVKNVKDGLVEIRSKVQDLIELNSTRVPEEQLRLEEFELDDDIEDIEAKDCEKDKQIAEIMITTLIDERNKWAENMKKIMWDDFDVKVCKINGFNVDQEVSNYPLRPIDESNLKELEILRHERRIEKKLLEVDPELHRAREAAVKRVTKLVKKRRIKKQVIDLSKYPPHLRDEMRKLLKDMPLESESDSDDSEGSDKVEAVFRRLTASSLAKSDDDWDWPQDQDADDDDAVESDETELEEVEEDEDEEEEEEEIEEVDDEEEEEEAVTQHKTKKKKPARVSDGGDEDIDFDPSMCAFWETTETATATQPEPTPKKVSIVKPKLPVVQEYDEMLGEFDEEMEEIEEEMEEIEEEEEEIEDEIEEEEEEEEIPQAPEEKRKSSVKPQRPSVRMAEDGQPVPAEGDQAITDAEEVQEPRKSYEEEYYGEDAFGTSWMKLPSLPGSGSDLEEEEEEEEEEELSSYSDDGEEHEQDEIPLDFDLLLPEVYYVKHKHPRKKRRMAYRKVNEDEDDDTQVLVEVDDSSDQSDSDMERQIKREEVREQQLTARLTPEEIEHQKKLQHLFSGSLTFEFFEPSSHLYNQLDLAALHEMQSQIKILMNEIRKLKVDFNASFEELKAAKAIEVEGIVARNKRIRKIAEFFDMDVEVNDPEPTVFEQPETIFEVKDSEIPVEKVLTEEETKKAKIAADAEAARLEKEALEAAMLPPDPQQQHEDLMKTEIPVPDFMVTKEEWQWSAEEMEKAAEYYQKREVFEQEKAENRKELEAELRELLKANAEAKHEFDTRLKQLQHSRMMHELSIRMEEVKLCRILRHVMKRFEVEAEEDRLSTLLKKLQNEIKATHRLAADLAARVDNCTFEYNTVTEKERLLERTFRMDLGEVGYFYDNFAKMYKKRPKLNFSADKSGELMRLAIRILGSQSLRLHHNDAEGHQAIEAIHELDDAMQTPVGCPRSTWDRFCRLRRDKIICEYEAKLISEELTVLHRVLNTFKAKEAEGQQSIAAVLSEVSRARDLRLGHTHNVEFQMVIRDGQIELPRALVRRDFYNAVLIQKHLVEACNVQIKKYETLKLGGLEREKVQHRAVKQIEWKFKKAQLEEKHAQEKLRDINTLRITKDVVRFLLTYDDFKAEEKRRLEAVRRLQNGFARFHDKVMLQKRIAMGRLRANIKNMVNDSKEKEELVLKKNMEVDERRMLCNVGDREEEIRAHRERMLIIMRSAYYMRRIAKNAEEICCLEEELDRLYAKTFPLL